MNSDPAGIEPVASDPTRLAGVDAVRTPLPVGARATKATALPAGDALAEPPEQVPINFPECVREEFPEEYPFAHVATHEVLERLSGVDFTPLGRHSPGLSEFDWSIYLKCSIARLVRVARAIRAAFGQEEVRILDFGTYFGNTGMMLDSLGYEVECVDSYREYAPMFDPFVQRLSERGMRVHDFQDVGYDLGGLQPESFDAVVCLGVIEHIPHTPRPLLEALTRVLRPGGLVVIDTPNLVYEARRKQMERGESVFLPIELQYRTEIPFNGHHREYTPDEVRWMLEHIPLANIELEMFDYSRLALPYMSGETLENYRAGLVDPTRREYILAYGSKPNGEAGDAGSEVCDSTAGDGPADRKVT